MNDILLDALSPSQIAIFVKLGMAPRDGHFDRYLPPKVRVHSRLHWTPLHVAVRIGKWLKENRVETVVDIGSGAGKFCVCAAMHALDTKFIGLEQRPHLVAAAERVAETFGVADRVTFVNGTLASEGCPRAAAYYFYNPFGENLFGDDGLIDTTIELGLERFVEDVSSTVTLMRTSPPGTYFILYNGFGAPCPPGLTEILTERHFPNILSIWRRDDEPRSRR